MRLWSLHPAYLDAKGLVALWREGLLAQAVLLGRTQGYTNHPQLARFRATAQPLQAITLYLRAVLREAEHRGYAFDASKVGPDTGELSIAVTQGQINYEWRHLAAKLRQRAPDWLHAAGRPKMPRAHPLFYIVPGDIEAWEVVHPT